MARFTLFFKDKPIKSHLFESGVIHIGRDNTNDISIDSLAVAPVHAIAVIRDTDCLLKQVNNNFPLMVNNQPHLEYCLSNNDRISIGKYAILYSQPNDTNTRLSPETNTPSNTEVDTRDANLQVMDGKHIGRIIPIKKAITRLGRRGEGVIIISKRKEGYFISALESNITLTINQKSLDDQIIKLSPYDMIKIDSITMQFFLD